MFRKMSSFNYKCLRNQSVKITSHHKRNWKICFGWNVVYVISVAMATMTANILWAYHRKVRHPSVSTRIYIVLLFYSKNFRNVASFRHFHVFVPKINAEVKELRELYHLTSPQCPLHITLPIHYAHRLKNSGPPGFTLNWLVSLELHSSKPSMIHLCSI